MHYNKSNEREIKLKRSEVMEELMNKRILVNQELVNWKLIDQEVVFLHSKEKVFYELNKTASYIWLAANGKNSVGEIMQGLSSKFPVEKEKAKKDAIEFITKALKNEIFLFAK